MVQWQACALVPAEVLLVGWGVHTQRREAILNSSADCLAEKTTTNLITQIKQESRAVVGLELEVSFV